MVTMIKYYYTCPIKALYMMKEFGVKIKQLGNYPTLPQEFVDISFEDMRDDILPYFNPRFEKENRLYVCQKSEHIFEPKESDLAVSKEFEKLKEIYILQNDRWRQFYNVGKIASVEFRKSPYFKIIIRDNKQFFQPEIENEHQAN